MPDRICKNCSIEFYIPKHRAERSATGAQFCNQKCRMSFTEKRKNTSLTQDYLKEIMTYDPDTGFFRWKIVPTYGARCKVGDIVGCPMASGYWQTNINQKHYTLHRLAWLYVNGKMPENFIDHINMDKSDNSIKNLREATKAQNQANTKIPRHNTTGFKGVTKDRTKKRPYIAQIGCDGAQHYLGRFKTAEEAHATYVEAAKRLFGEFANSG